MGHPMQLPRDERMREFETWLVRAVDDLLPYADPWQRIRLRRIRALAGGGRGRGPTWMRSAGTATRD